MGQRIKPLTDYGIFDEKSQYRIHVSVMGRRVYVFPIKPAVERLRQYHYPKGAAQPEGITTGYGYLVPPDDLPGLIAVSIPDDLYRQADFDPRDDTSTKGRKATSLVQGLFQRGLIPLVKVNLNTMKSLQVKGIDLLVAPQLTLEIKCDWRGGDGPGCTGNLFIQIAERNLYNEH